MKCVHVLLALVALSGLAACDRGEKTGGAGQEANQAGQKADGAGKEVTPTGWSAGAMQTAQQLADKVRAAV